MQDTERRKEREREKRYGYTDKTRARNKINRWITDADDDPSPKKRDRCGTPCEVGF